MREEQRANVFYVAYRNYWWNSLIGGLYFVVGFILWGGSRGAIVSSSVFAGAVAAGLLLHYWGPFTSRRSQLAMVLASLMVGQAVLVWQKTHLPLSDYTSTGNPAARDTLTYLVSALFVGTMSMFAGKWGALLGLVAHYLFIFDPGEEFTFKWVFPLLIAAAGMIVSSAFWKLDEAYDRMEILAVQDSLTGLMNRRRLPAEFEELQQIARDTGVGLLLIAWDLDHLKRVNDTNGHAAGDAYIREFAVALHATVRRASADRAPDAAFRVGGDEFISLHVGATDGRTVVDRVRGVFPSVSAGWIECQSLTLDQALTGADHALYRDKVTRTPTAVS
jgi:diguanylate cyclase (GGDEF)-like protein